MDIQLEEVWRSVRNAVDWMLVMVVVLVFLNVILAGYLLYGWFGSSDFHERFNLPPSDPYAARLDTLREAEARVDTPPAPQPSSRPLPSRLADLEASGLFDPLGQRVEPPPSQSHDTSDRRPPVTGYRLVGKVSTPDGRDYGVLQRSSDGKTFVVREGETIGEDPIRVTKIEDTSVTLSASAHRSTVFSLPESGRYRQLRQRIEGP